MPYTNRPFNPNTPYENQVESELELANDNFDILAQVFLDNNPATRVLKSDIYTFRKVDLTNSTTDYFLDIGEEAKISFSSATSVPLRIATQSGTLYQGFLVCTNTAGTSGGTNNPIFINPNNTTYANAIAYVELSRSTSASGSVSTTYSAFRCGFAFSRSTFFITNFTQYKNIHGLYSVYGLTGTHPQLAIFSADWRNTTIEWTSLGTLVFPQSTSGFIIIRRLE